MTTGDDSQIGVSEPATGDLVICDTDLRRATPMVKPRRQPICRAALHTRPRTTEPHLAGEFPMSCYECHIVADS